MAKAQKDVTKLPRWAQEMLAGWRDEYAKLAEELERTRQAHTILTEREWFVINGPPYHSRERARQLWVLDRDAPHSLCRLGPGDVLLIGRHLHREPEHDNEG